ncbi:hypothetical protein KPH14_010724 [Odynerus spinipes]|uniref:Cytochrome c oxidase subunit NDUFA4 n=1 Tax=Odynerus spinipes TaxID=1348599 RepID=A0AAD9RV07_9HYME|nr:hypothetical protein KPH14_010724 [Odynerus spinipes]
MSETKKSGPIMGGLTISSLKKNYPLIPLFVVVGVAVSGAVFYTLRLATRCPDVTWNVKKNPEPWHEYADKQYKFYSSTNEPVKSPAPKY